MNLARRVIGVGGSVGAIRATVDLLSALPADLPAALLVVIHTSEDSPGLLPQLFRRHCRLPVHAAADLVLESGVVYIAVPGRHLIVRRDAITVTESPRETRNRPGIDPMLRSLARAYQERAVGVVLSGYLDDGTAGLATIKYCGGIAVVQDPGEAEAPSMPLSALAHVDVDHVVSKGALPRLLEDLVRSPPPPARIPAAELLGLEALLSGRVLSGLTGFLCPECGGALSGVYRDGRPALECPNGHRHGSDSVSTNAGEASEEALQAAVKSLEEGAQLARRMMHRAIETHQSFGIERFRRRAEKAEEHIRVLHTMLGRTPAPTLTSTIPTATDELESSVRKPLADLI